MEEPDPRVVLIGDGDLDDDVDQSGTIRVAPPSGPRHVMAFERLAAVVQRVPTTEVPTVEPPDDDAGILVHTRLPEPRGPGPRLRQEALDALVQAESGHEAALAHSHECWQVVRECEDEAARLLAEESAALRAFELLRDGRRNAERTLRQARAEAEAAGQHCLITSRLLDGARIRAERALLR